MWAVSSFDWLHGLRRDCCEDDDDDDVNYLWPINEVLLSSAAKLKMCSTTTASARIKSKSLENIKLSLQDHQISNLSKVPDSDSSNSENVTDAECFLNNSASLAEKLIQELQMQRKLLPAIEEVESSAPSIDTHIPIADSANRNSSTLNDDSSFESSRASLAPDTEARTSVQDLKSLFDQSPNTSLTRTNRPRCDTYTKSSHNGSSFQDLKSKFDKCPNSLSRSQTLRPTSNGTSHLDKDWIKSSSFHRPNHMQEIKSSLSRRSLKAVESSGDSSRSSSTTSSSISYRTMKSDSNDNSSDTDLESCLRVVDASFSGIFDDADLYVNVAELRRASTLVKALPAGDIYMNIWDCASALQLKHGNFSRMSTLWVEETCSELVVPEVSPVQCRVDLKIADSVIYWMRALRFECHQDDEYEPEENETFNLKSSVGGSTPVVLIKLPAKEGSRAPKAIAENTDISSSKPINSSQKKTIKNILQKFLQRRPTENVLLDKGIMKHNLFGNTLEDICKDLGSNGALQVPPMIPALIACIERNVNSLGLYRASGNIAHIQKLRLELEKAPTTAHITQAVQSFHNDVDVLTGALKLFFRELRKPLLSLEFRNGVIDIRDRNLSLDAQYEQISALVEALEPYNRDVLLVMLRHLLYVTQHIEQNQMSIDGMAIVWGPSLFSTGNCGQTAMLQCITDNNSALNFVMKVFDASTQFEIYPYKESGQRLHLQSERSKDLQVNEGRIRMLIKHIEESDVVHKKDIYSTKRSLDKAEKKVWALLTGEKDLRVLVNSKEGVYAMAQILQECVKKQNLIPKAVRDLDLQSDISDRDYAITREAILRMSQTEQELLDLVLAHLLRLKEEHAYIYEKSIVDNWSPVLFPEHRKLFGHMDHMLEYRRYMKNSVIRNEYASSHSLQSASNSVRQSETNHGFLESDTVELRKQPTLDGVGSYRPMRRSSEERKKNRHS